MRPWAQSRSIASLLIVFLLMSSLVLVGCESGGDSGDAGSAEASTTPSPPVSPPPPALDRPETAVYSYLVWISYAYRILDSTVAEHAFSPYEEVRVNSYVEFNRQNGRAIDQQLTNFEVRSVVTEENTATVEVSESWKYRYIDIETGEFTGPENTVSYESVYTVILYPDKGWLVDSVVAQPDGDVE